MMLIFGLMLLLETAACVEVNCSFDQSGPCSAALGDKLRLKLVDASKYNLKIQKRNYNTQDDPVCKIKDDTMKECDLFNNRYDKVSVKNGILVINSVIRADSGNYRLQVFASDGTETSRDLQVIVEGEDPAIIAIVLGCLAVVLILLVIVAYYFYKKKNQLKPTRNHVNEHDAQKREEEQKRPDVEYATVNSQNNKNKRKKKMKEEEVHYGEVTFTSSSVQRPRQTHEDCVYSEVHTR
ncbi:uncharacterized protein si:zfos-741a10.3 isoform X3 [Rhinichthys klamathensis goyatoka]|uniref:uncharacterized protein si:zfos-741a10.3 isoform X3 n=1 Tax=Rhinichthys klamathensis goyatoka TaxID=3034132 RepID=UPI0024B583D4|nr:uncharacterized protein si:zfos-741a10.3 isoform X3 [Rhinichthys klamathensis goyatoka]